MNLPNYSFLVSVYSKEIPLYFKQSIQSMLDQTFFPSEIIIVKDGPLTSELNQILDTYCSKFPGIFNVINLEKNYGLGYALNIGIQYVKNDYIARMDSDDISLPNRIETQLTRMVEDEKIVLIGSNVIEFNEKNPKINSIRKVPSQYKDIIKFSKKRSPFNHPTVIFKKNIIDKIGGYPNLRRKEDLEFFLRILENGYYAENIDSNLLLYRINSENYKRRKTFENCFSYIKVMKKFYFSKYITLFDLIFIIISQIFLFFSPIWLQKLITTNFLRKTI